MPLLTCICLETSDLAVVSFCLLNLCWVGNGLIEELSEYTLYLKIKLDYCTDNLKQIVVELELLVICDQL